MLTLGPLRLALHCSHVSNTDQIIHELIVLTIRHYVETDHELIVDWVGNRSRDDLAEV
jgi:hypothetical protein